ncbi:unnamed protein product [Amoebophrya sp. A120]|nr:unnamed protein product [Amoebophrya sp. A120]|eukprot:GSA120T00005789001.1
MPGSVYSERSTSSRSAASTAYSIQKARPVRKTARHDIVNGSVIHNPYTPEVMAALRSRGGPTWLRGHVEHMSGVDALGYNHGLYAAVKNLGNFEVNFNQLFGLSAAEADLNKTLINRLTLALEAVAEDRHDGQGRALDMRLFTEACHQCGLGHLRPQTMKKMFSRIDASQDGWMSFREWLALLDSAHPKTSNRPSVNLDAQQETKQQMMSSTVANSTGRTNLVGLTGGADPRAVSPNYSEIEDDEEIIEEEEAAVVQDSKQMTGSTVLASSAKHLQPSRASSKSTAASLRETNGSSKLSSSSSSPTYDHAPIVVTAPQ